MYNFEFGNRCTPIHYLAIDIMKRIVTIISFMAVLFGCEIENVNRELSVTVGYDNLTAISVILKGKANIGSMSASDLEIGFQYSTSAGILPNNSITIIVLDPDANYNYTTVLTGLSPETTYYFRSFVRQNGQDYYGETKEFITKELSSLLRTEDAIDIGGRYATLKAKLDLTGIDYESDIYYGFYWGTSESAQDNEIQGNIVNDLYFSSDLSNLSPQTKYYFKAYVMLGSQTLYGELKSFTTDFVPCPTGAVDLGLSVYWAACNISEEGFVSSPEDYGDYYAWGEIEPYYSSFEPLAWKEGKSGYNWSSYRWSDGTATTLTKYNTNSSFGEVDNKTVLEPEDDVAHVKLGGKWRLPTYEEYYELKTKCTWTWTINNGVSGNIVTGPNGNSIFLPAAGIWSEYGLNRYNVLNTPFGLLWSASLDAECPDYAFYAATVEDYPDISHRERYYGFTIRPVTE